MSIKGKALLVITRVSDSMFDVHGFIQSCSSRHPDGADAVQDEFQHMRFEIHPLPVDSRKIGLGETWRIAVTYECSWHHDDFTGEYDSGLYFDKVRVLRRQKARDRYVTKRKG